MKAKTEKLKRCPFCGGIADVFFQSGCDYWYDKYAVYCTQCGCTTEDFETKEEAISVWNRRTNDE